MSAGDWKNLFHAVETGNYDLVEYHVKNGVNLNYQHPEILMTLLVTAIKLRQNKIAELLLDNGADPDLESYYDQLAPLQAALKYKNTEVLAKLKTMGVEISLLQKIKMLF